MPIIAETHCHTVASGHAYSTILENVHAAKQKGLRFVCITEHCPAMFDAPAFLFFENIINAVPDVVDGVIILKGAEANILDFDGKLDLTQKQLRRLDWVIASYHVPCCAPGTPEENTRGWLAVAQNPDVDVVGHCGDARYAFDHEAVIKAFAENKKIVEFNSHSFSCRPGSSTTCRDVALLCKQYGVRVVCSSDAHFAMEVGSCESSLEMLREIDYPEELILNLDFERFLAVAREKSGRALIDD